MGKRPRVSSYQCFCFRLVKLETNLCFSSFQHHTESAEEVERRWSGWYPYLSYVEDCHMVSGDASDVGCTTSPTQEWKINVNSTSYRRVPSITQKTEISSMFPIREALQSSGLPENTCKIILKSWRDTTHKQYNVYLRKYVIFCSERNENPFQPSVENTLNFLTHLSEQGQKYSAINTARSALSALWSVLGFHSVGSHPLISRFLKGSYENDPPVPRYKLTWDVSLVLNYFQKLKSNEFLSLPDLTKKLFALLLLTTAQRIQTIHSLRISCIHQVNQNIEIEVIDKIKQSKPGIETKITLEPYEKKKLCVVRTLEEYLKRTKNLRKFNEDKLFLCFKKPFKAASKDTTSRWMKNVMDSSGIDISIFKQHSFRSATSSSTLKEGVPLETVLKKAGWSSASTFYKFYYRDTKSQKNQGSIRKFLGLN